MCLKVFVEGDEKMYSDLSSPAMALGSAFQKVNFLRDLKADHEGLNRSYFPNLNIENFDEISKQHILSEIEKISNRMVLINNGEKIVEGNVQELMQNELLKVSFKSENLDSIVLCFKKQSIEFESSNDSIVANINEENIPLILKKMIDENISITEMKQMRTLEELFLGLTK